MNADIQVTLVPEERTGLEGLAAADLAFVETWAHRLPAVIRTIREIGLHHGPQAAQQALEDLRNTLETAKQRCDEGRR